MITGHVRHALAYRWRGLPANVGPGSRQKARMDIGASESIFPMLCRPRGRLNKKPVRSVRIRRGRRTLGSFHAPLSWGVVDAGITWARPRPR